MPIPTVVAGGILRFHRKSSDLSWTSALHKVGSKGYMQIGPVETKTSKEMRKINKRDERNNRKRGRGLTHGQNVSGVPPQETLVDTHISGESEHGETG